MFLKVVLFTGISDHDVTFVIRRAGLPKIKTQPKIIRVRKYNKFDNEAFLNDLKKKNFDQIKTSQTILMRCEDRGKGFTLMS